MPIKFSDCTGKSHEVVGPINVAAIKQHIEKTTAMPTDKQSIYAELEAAAEIPGGTQILVLLGQTADGFLGQPFMVKQPIRVTALKQYIEKACNIPADTQSIYVEMEDAAVFTADGPQILMIPTPIKGPVAIINANFCKDTDGQDNHA